MFRLQICRYIQTFYKNYFKYKKTKNKDKIIKVKKNYDAKRSSSPVLNVLSIRK